MRKYLAYSLLVAVLFGNSGAGCGSKNEDDPKPVHMQTLIGKWEAIRANYEITEHNGTVKNTGPELKSNGTIIIWEFFSDGRLKATGNTNPGRAMESREVRWELNVTRLDGKNIDVGTLTIIGDEERKLAKELGQTGELTYNIEASNPISGSDFAIMHLSVDATKVGPYKKNILTYTYHKL
ncbi:hypothetical protein [Spirosoma sp.]|uniref:hypothetical protein n=1 Tax=Spirosoma sp. TaxID=1899569 RepID=UPI003B3A964F